ncbi:putative glucan 1-3-beta-glucosidase A [Penicillium angulare]|uniref:Glucan 1-3-beta-glucosidase A n=1 Tax=Penicillium angulare TaxID=116970 RepID=A0A9W9G8M1_9EURO|nr:putative glucan 1-3-beta-glucosidase A [Penicillium angulare]
MVLGRLEVKAGKVVDIDNGDAPLILRGAAIGGWMNMENFITGYAGHEREHRAALLEVLGKEKYDHFFNEWLWHFFTEADAKYFASLGLNCIRIPFNYQHFEDDMSPRVLKPEGFKHLDRVIDICAKYNIYTILDMHAVPGGQNPDWHSDNPTNVAAFWDHKDFQDRTIWLWRELAHHYKDQPWVAGYNPLNEPADPEYTRLAEFYDRVEKEIRVVDPDHILWLDGNTFAMEWKGFTHILPNCVYSLHDYSTMGFPTGDRFKGTEDQCARLSRQFLRKCEFMRENGCPIWNGEFGPVYANPEDEANSMEINEERIALLGAQLQIYAKYDTHWSIWLYKDIGLQGMVTTSPESPWNKLIKPFLHKKRATQADAWGKFPSAEVDALINPLADWLDKYASGVKTMYPPVWDTRRHITRLINEGLLSKALAKEFAELFVGKTKEELSQLAESFSFENCVQREALNRTLQDSA